MKYYFKTIFILVFYFIVEHTFSQAYSDYNISQMLQTCHYGDYKISENGDSLYARYLDVNFNSDPSGTQFLIEVSDVTDTNNVIVLATKNFSTPINNTDNSGVYSIDRVGNNISIFMSYMSLFSRYRLKVWLNNANAPCYITEF